MSASAITNFPSSNSDLMRLDSLLGSTGAVAAGITTNSVVNPSNSISLDDFLFSVDLPPRDGVAPAMELPAPVATAAAPSVQNQEAQLLASQTQAGHKVMDEVWKNIQKKREALAGQNGKLPRGTPTPTTSMRLRSMDKNQGSLPPQQSLEFLRDFVNNTAQLPPQGMPSLGSGLNFQDSFSELDPDIFFGDDSALLARGSSQAGSLLGRQPSMAATLADLGSTGAPDALASSHAASLISGKVQDRLLLQEGGPSSLASFAGGLPGLAGGAGVSNIGVRDPGAMALLPEGAAGLAGSSRYGGKQRAVAFAQLTGGGTLGASDLSGMSSLAGSSGRRRGTPSGTAERDANSGLLTPGWMHEGMDQGRTMGADVGGMLASGLGAGLNAIMATSLAAVAVPALPLSSSPLTRQGSKNRARLAAAAAAAGLNPLQQQLAGLVTSASLQLPEPAPQQARSQGGAALGGRSLRRAPADVVLDALPVPGNVVGRGSTANATAAAAAATRGRRRSSGAAEYGSSAVQPLGAIPPNGNVGVAAPNGRGKGQGMLMSGPGGGVVGASSNSPGRSAQGSAAIAALRKARAKAGAVAAVPSGSMSTSESSESGDSEEPAREGASSRQGNGRAGGGGGRGREGGGAQSRAPEVLGLVKAEHDVSVKPEILEEDGDLCVARGGVLLVAGQPVTLPPRKRGRGARNDVEEPEVRQLRVMERRVKCRESAQRSRARKQARRTELEGKVSALKGENERLKAAIRETALRRSKRQKALAEPPPAAAVVAAMVGKAAGAVSGLRRTHTFPG
eukprot:jgi/Mesvir1/18087/Mv09388-RA.1